MNKAHENSKKEFEAAVRNICAGVESLSTYDEDDDEIAIRAELELLKALYILRSVICLLTPGSYEEWVERGLAEKAKAPICPCCLEKIPEHRLEQERERVRRETKQ